MVTYNQEQIKQALQLAEFDVSAAHEKMNPRPRGTRPPEMPGQPKQGAVLVIAYNRNGGTYLVLTRRRDDLNAHAGQISFPGGQREQGETMRLAAFREAEEEIGASIPALDFLGELTPIYIPPTDFEVHPFVAWYRDDPIFTPQDREVAEILEVPISHLMNPATKREETWEFQGQKIVVPFYLFGTHKIWGATATMMSEFLERLRALS